MSEPHVPERPSAEGSVSPAPRRRWYRDWRVWLGVVITAVSLWFAGRGIPIDEVMHALRRADLVLLLVLSVPAYVASIYFRALRWGHLTKPIASIPSGTLFRATAVGFMINNLVPLRIGELVRSWVLARETGTSATSILGTVVLERVLDVVSVLLLAGVALAFVGSGAESSTGLLRQGALLLLPVAAAPLGLLVVLRVAPDRAIALARWVLRPLPQGVGDQVEKLLRGFADGLGALSGGSHLFWIAVHSAIIWLVCSTLPVLAGLLAFGIDMGSPTQLLLTSWITLGAVGVAVAVPSAPGFFGTYQLAFTAVLEGFGVDRASALALGLLVWFVFWVTLTLLGLIVLRVQRTSLEELTRRPR